MKQGFWADLLCGIGNTYWDLARILSLLAFLSVVGLAILQIRHGEIPKLAEYADAIMKVFVGCGAFIAGKDVARAYSKGAANP